MLIKSLNKLTVFWTKFLLIYIYFKFISIREIIHFYNTIEI